MAANVQSTKPVTMCVIAQQHSMLARQSAAARTSISVSLQRALPQHRSAGIASSSSNYTSLLCSHARGRRCEHTLRAYKVEIEHEGQTHHLTVPSGETILSVALDQGLDLPHDCKLGVCMTCPAKLVSGKVANGSALLTEEVAEAGYTLLCMAEPTSDCKIKTISEDELLDLQLGSS